MSLAEAETANVESINKAKANASSRFGLTGLKQFAASGLDLKIGEFRALSEELYKAGRFDSPHAVMDSLFAWMMETLNPDAK